MASRCSSFNLFDGTVHPSVLGDFGRFGNNLEFYNTALRVLANLDEAQSFSNKTLYATAAQADGTVLGAALVRFDAFLRDIGNVRNLHFNDGAANPTVERQLKFYGEEFRAYLEGWSRRILLQQYPGINPGVGEMRNPSAEVDADNVAPTGWVRSAGCNCVTDDADAYDGGKSFLMPATDDAGTSIQQSISLKKGQALRVTVASKASAVGDAVLQIADGALLLIYPPSNLTTGAWEILSYESLPVASDKNLTITLTKQSTIANNRPVWFDHVCVQVIDNPGFGVLNKVVITSADSPYTLKYTTDLLICDTSGGAITVNLYSAAAIQNKRRTIKNIGANNATIDGSGAETIDDDLTKTLLQYESMDITSDGTEWWVV